MFMHVKGAGVQKIPLTSRLAKRGQKWMWTNVNQEIAVVLEIHFGNLKQGSDAGEEEKRESVYMCFSELKINWISYDTLYELC